MSQLMDSMITLSIDHMSISVPSGSTILEASKMCGVDIPSLCYHPDQAVKGNCRVCMVSVKGSRKLVAACSTPVWEGMEVLTYTREVRDMQKGVLALILANHHQDCLTCVRNGTCELQVLAERFNITTTELPSVYDTTKLSSDNVALGRDPSKCIKCLRCVDVCQNVQTVSALGFSHRSNHYAVTTPYQLPIEETQCVYCGQCAAVCPTGAIFEKDDTQKAWQLLEDPRYHVVVQVAPAVRVAIGEHFGAEDDQEITKKLVTALRRLGFDGVFDTNFTADLTIVEEGHELLKRLKNGGKLPMVTSCSPGWVKFMEDQFSDLMGYVSTCKSPQQMFGALSKSYYADILGIESEKVKCISIMPCTAKKYEAKRPEMSHAGNPDVDVVLTTRELTRMLKEAGLVLEKQVPSDFDTPFGIASGAGAIFGASGGVMEAALRTANSLVNKTPMETLHFEALRGLQGIKVASLSLGGIDLKVACASGLAHARRLMDEVRAGRSPYHFIEIMACPSGCLGGGGQPHGGVRPVKEARMQALYTIDETATIRMSHLNPAVQALYQTYLGEPLGHKSHQLLHTSYGKGNKDKA